MVDPHLLFYETNAALIYHVLIQGRPLSEFIGIDPRTALPWKAAALQKYWENLKKSLIKDQKARSSGDSSINSIRNILGFAKKIKIKQHFNLSRPRGYC
jgi:hypothetical protein